MGAEVLRIARVTSVYDYFIQAVQNLLNKNEETRCSNERYYPIINKNDYSTLFEFHKVF